MSSESDSIDWNTEDELEINNLVSSPCSNRELVASSWTPSSSSVAINSTLIDQFMEMGFPKHLVIRALKENGDCKLEEAVLGSILTYTALEDPANDNECTPENPSSAYTNLNCTDLEFDLSDDEYSAYEESMDPSSEKEATPLSLLLAMGYGHEEAVEAIDKCGKDTQIEEIVQFIAAAPFSHNSDPPVQDSTQNENKASSCGKDKPLAVLLEMGYRAEEVLAAINRCGTGTPIEELIQFIAASGLRQDLDAPRQGQDPGTRSNFLKKRRNICSTSRNHMNQNLKRNQEFKKHHRTQEDDDDDDEDVVTHLPKPMIGFGVPGLPFFRSRRNIHPDAIGPPYFYYENVALTPKGVWPKIERFLYDIKPEFVDSKYFSAACRKRGYIHNLPIQNRFQLLPSPPLTIQELFPLSRRWWPNWDQRTKLNCLVTCIGSAKLTERIKKAIEKSSNDDEEPPSDIKKFVMEQCKKWNLIWVGRNKVAPLEPDEMEEIMGFPKYHTRGGGISKTDRHKFLGNSFQVDTVAYHLSVLKNLYPGGINVLSLFTGIGGAEVALHRLGIPLKNVVSVEISEHCRNIVESWWRETGQQGKLFHVRDVQEVDGQMLEHWISKFGGFDLVIGGSPCNNLAGGNRVSRDGLEGKHSSLFYEYYRILEYVRSITRDQF